MTYDNGFWAVVAIHVFLLVAFAFAFLRPARRREWRSLRILSAFVVALSVEMFGFPLTIYVLTALLGGLPASEPFAHASGNLWATLLLGGRLRGRSCLSAGRDPRRNARARSGVGQAVSPAEGCS